MKQGNQNILIQITPLARQAYFDDYVSVAKQEFKILFPEAALSYRQYGKLDFFETELHDSDLDKLLFCSFVQGIYRLGDGESLRPIESEPDLRLPDTLVTGMKYQGKTNEMVTQLAINLAIAHCRSAKVPKSLLDPMAGRGTTLLWGLRYGLNSQGIELNPEALVHLERHLKGQAKIHRFKHTHQKGVPGGGKKQKEAEDRFIQFQIGEQHLRLFSGDSRNGGTLLAGQRFDLIVSDLPYGIQFGGGQKRNPIDLVADCAPAWVERMKGGGAMVLIFNRYQPKRTKLAGIFESLGCMVQPFSAPHRMGESIVRDLMVITR